ncbi:MAG: hypothetical protein A2268_08555 [Candidatus Raymondbacteria bacterium RifOxyA12_full_50_37]|uniref:Cell division protein FtsB n=1 Tax=Candidatus Raymondbacteria bacterium RIFOXYD12_FULL_49_13 TaxID=1817890 RepID=A0A1F7FKW1_UNCRA|nr:MAG: hypothetical protein A2268_08555 [Candidatus Raymondbacteria bacterium RifOxyA12_full_50_37]OGJ90834.1 MAG: hypothetical protein A2248_07130 [Candidatus Raymondbacteria bacterium RIFOXYA2_FULL_49_16]OGJ98642.1 MAG: hypothetical protein A2453_05075 [Candidatus Raymondbacteria bacterium RIFOXYC2_FULL_50_21]OGK00406.1 MAG: hypothetical protein A2350_14935 [Candidatus Raymondbacteria bacterium RifOxyB12_full_50_8]OGK05244.1 MAG: hypothetical protein A2487_10995 [Candidatus Raymondbacteria b
MGLFSSIQNAPRAKQLAWIAIIFGLLLLFLFLFGGKYGFVNMYRLSDERTALERTLDSLAAEQESIKRDIKKLETDRSEIERIAREKYGMAKKGEKVYKFSAPADTVRK